MQGCTMPRHVTLLAAVAALLVAVTSADPKQSFDLPAVTSGLAANASIEICANLRNIREEQGAVRLGDHVYLFNNNSKKSWSEAQKFCKSLHMQLANIEDPEENALVIEHANATDARWQEMWLGATDEALEGQFVWSPSGRPLTFTYWHPGRPSGGATFLNCLTLWRKRDGQVAWADGACDFELPFICKSPTKLSDCSEISNDL